MNRLPTRDCQAGEQHVDDLRQLVDAETSKESAVDAPMMKRATQAGLEKSWAAATLFAAALLLSGAAIYNGYPLLDPDTSGYLRPVNIGYRSFFYSLFLDSGRLAGSLWLVVFIQSLIEAHLLRLILRVVFRIASAAAFIAITALLCVLTCLPWCTGFIMPDVFTSVLVLCFFLLAFCSRRLRPAELGYIFALTVVAATVHFSHLPLAVGLLLMTVLVRITCRKQPQIPPPNLILPALPIAVALLVMMAVNYFTLGEAAFSVNGYAFPLARLVADGQAVIYLREACPQRSYALCEYIDRLPNDSDKFLWSPDSPFRKVGWFAGYRREGREIVVHTIMRFPLWTLKSALKNTARQVVEVRTGTGYGFASYKIYENRQDTSDEIRTYCPSEYGAFENSRQSRGELAHLYNLNRLHRAALILSFLYCCAMGLLFARRGQWLQTELLVTIACAVLVNSFVSGALSRPSARYGSRLIWLLSLFALASYRQAYDLLWPARASSELSRSERLTCSSGW